MATGGVGANVTSRSERIRASVAPIVLQPLPMAPGLANFMGTYMESAVTVDSVEGEIPLIQEALQYLDNADELFIQGVIDQYTVHRAKFEDVYNRYFVKNADEQLVFFVAEWSRVNSRACCGMSRSMILSVYDKFEREVMSFSRPGDHGCCWSRCTDNVLEVQAPPGNVIGFVKQKCSWCRCNCCSPDFYVTDADGTRRLFDIRGPCCNCKCCSAVDYEIVSRDVSGINGSLTNMACGCYADVNLCCGNWHLVFPRGISWQSKATLLGSLFHIDYSNYAGGKSFGQGGSYQVWY